VPIPSARLPFEELDSRSTPMGVISLRRRIEPTRGVDVYEAKLGDEFLMSSLFTVAEVELARLGLGALDLADDGAPDTEVAGVAAAAGEVPDTDAAAVDVVVGGLGLGYTARTVLEDPRVRSLVVVEALDEVIGWHRQGLLPDAERLGTDDRCRLVHGDLFAMAAGDDGFDPDHPGRRFDAILVDIDHSPRHLLHPSHAPFYTPDGLRAMARHLRPGGVFGLWSDDPPDEDFLGTLAEVFDASDAHVVGFPNFLTGGESTNTVYLAS
jgi:hypothetical protein